MKNKKSKISKNVVYRLRSLYIFDINLITKFFIFYPWFSRNNSISGKVSLKAFRKESFIILKLIDFYGILVQKTQCVQLI